MKRVLIYLFTALMSFPLFAQVPDGFSYQAVLRDNQGAIMSNQSISLRLSILDASSVQVYQEVHDTITSEFGLISLVVGQGSPVSGIFTTINWQMSTYFMEVEVDETGGSNYSSLGSFQLLTVPFAMYANKAMDVDDADADPVNELQVISKSGSTVTLSNGGGSFTDEVVDADADSLNEIQTLTLNNDTLALSGGGTVSLGTYASKWETTPAGINYPVGNVGINKATPTERFVVKDSIATGPFATSLIETFVDPNTIPFQNVGNWGQVSFLQGQVSTTNRTYTAYEGISLVNKIGGIQTYNRGVTGIADSAFQNVGVIGLAGVAGGTTNDFNIGTFGRAQGSTLANRGLEGHANGNSATEQAVFGLANSNGTTYNGGVVGHALNGANSNYGVRGSTTGTGNGFNIGVRGSATGNSGSNTNYGIYGTASNGGVNYAGYFDGDVRVLGTLIKSGGTFQIDHPLDPANQYLTHSFVESPDMLNVYNGNITTDANGFATVSLPEYFDAANKDFKYQLTVIGTFAQAIIAEELSNNQFIIRTDQSHVKVSWQVTGVRNDPWADANRVQVEVQKTGKEAGKYLHPELYGQPKSMGLPQPKEHPESLAPSNTHSLSGKPYLSPRNK